MVRLLAGIRVTVVAVIKVIISGGSGSIRWEQRRFGDAIAERTVIVLRNVRVEAVGSTDGGRTARVARCHVELVHVEVPELCNFTILLVGSGYIDGLARGQRIEHGDVVLHVVGSRNALLYCPGGDAGRGSRCEGRHEVCEVQIIGQRLQHRVERTAVESTAKCHILFVLTTTAAGLASAATHLSRLFATSTVHIQMTVQQVVQLRIFGVVLHLFVGGGKGALCFFRSLSYTLY